MKMPTTLYAKIEDGGTGPDYINASPEMMALVEMGEKVKIGVYRLVGLTEAEGTITTKTVKKKPVR